MNKPAPPKDGPQGTRVFRPEDVPKVTPQKNTSQEISNIGKSASLFCLTEPNQGNVHHLIKERTTIGRNPDNDICLNDGTVSAFHGRIVQDQGIWKVINLLSSNGIFVNGEKVSQSVIKTGDRVRFGDIDFKFEVASNKKKSQENNNLYTLIAVGVIIAGAVAAAYFFLT